MTRAPVDALPISGAVRTSFLTDANPSPCPTETLTAEWWKVLEGADLMEFTTNDKQKSVSAKWAQLKKKVAKLTRGRSEDNDKATNLAIQHWLEAIDPTHRYGHNLHVYFKHWEMSDTKDQFFYWLDHGDGRSVDLEKCSRSKLEEEKIVYLGPKERKPYEVVFVDGRFCYRQSKKNLDGEKMIFVLSTKMKFYAGQKQKGRFQHSSFLAGGSALAAGRLTVKDGVLKCLEAHSGHYRPSAMNFKNFVDLLSSATGVDVTTMILSASHDESKGRQRSLKRRQSGHDDRDEDQELDLDADLDADADDSTTLPPNFFDAAI